MDRTGSIQRQFAAVAPRYKQSRYHHGGPDLAALVEAGEFSGTERVLDVGTGTGHTALAVAPRVAGVVGLDLTTAMLAQARELSRERAVPNARFERGNAMALPHPDACYDVVTCRVCAHHFADPAAAVREAARVLRPGGRLLLVDSVAPEDPALDTFFNAIEVLRDPSHVRNHRVSEWCSMLEAAGLEAEHLASFAVSLDFEEWVERMHTPQVARDALRALFRGATRGIQRAFALRTGDAWGFDIPIALLRGRRPG